jgi:putative oxidoreductase
MKNKLFSLKPLDTDIAALLLRLLFGGLFVYYGYLKIDAYHQILPMFKNIIGIGSKLSFNLLIFAEFFCGLLVTVGFLTRLTVIPIFIAMAVAFFIAHAHDPFQVSNLAFVFLCLSPIVFVLGSGKYSIDSLIFKK